TACDDDGNQCTDDECNGVSNVCQHPNDDTNSCSDGLFCTGTESCTAGVCGSSTGDPCSGPDGDGDCSESCDEANDNCLLADVDGSFCNDSLFCNGTDTCLGGSCDTHTGDPCV